MIKVSSSFDDFFNECYVKKIPLVLYGAYERCDTVYNILRLAKIFPYAVVDNDIKKHGAFFKDVMIKPLAEVEFELNHFNVFITVPRELEHRAVIQLSQALKNIDATVFLFSTDPSIASRLLSYVRKQTLLNTNFTIISNSCIGHDIYMYLNVKVQTPTNRMIIYPLHFLKFCEKLDYYMHLPITFKHNKLSTRDRYNDVYPVGSVGDIDIHFVHDTDFDVCKKRWNSDVSENLYIVFDDAHFPPNRKLAERFDALPFDNKLLFTPYDYGDLKSVCVYNPKKVWTSGALNVNSYIRYERFDFVKWLNNGGAGGCYKINDLFDDLPDEYIEWLYSGGISSNYALNDLMVSRERYTSPDGSDFSHGGGHLFPWHFW